MNIAYLLYDPFRKYFHYMITLDRTNHKQLIVINRNFPLKSKRIITESDRIGFEKIIRYIIKE